MGGGGGPQKKNYIATRLRNDRTKSSIIISCVEVKRPFFCQYSVFDKRKLTDTFISTTITSLICRKMLHVNKSTTLEVACCVSAARTQINTRLVNIDIRFNRLVPVHFMFMVCFKRNLLYTPIKLHLILSYTKTKQQNHHHHPERTKQNKHINDLNHKKDTEIIQTT